MSNDGVQGVRTSSSEPVLRISARSANPILSLDNLCISIQSCKSDLSMRKISGLIRAHCRAFR